MKKWFLRCIFLSLLVIVTSGCQYLNSPSGYTVEFSNGFMVSFYEDDDIYLQASNPTLSFRVETFDSFDEGIEWKLSSDLIWKSASLRTWIGPVSLTDGATLEIFNSKGEHTTHKTYTVHIEGTTECQLRSISPSIYNSLSPTFSASQTAYNLETLSSKRSIDLLTMSPFASAVAWRWQGGGWQNIEPVTSTTPRYFPVYRFSIPADPTPLNGLLEVRVTSEDAATEKIYSITTIVHDSNVSRLTSLDFEVGSLRASIPCTYGTYDSSSLTLTIPSWAETITLDPQLASTEAAGWKLKQGSTEIVALQTGPAQITAPAEGTSQTLTVHSSTGSKYHTFTLQYERAAQSGFLSTSFDSSTGANGNVRALKQLSSGKILAAGDFTEYNGASAGRIVRLNLDGSRDSSFSAGTGADLEIRALALQSDGKILVAGSFANWGGSSRSRVARLFADGSLDSAFIPPAIPGTVEQVFALPEGKVLVCGSFQYSSGGQNSNALVLSSNGTLFRAIPVPVYSNETSPAEFRGGHVTSTGAIVLIYLHEQSNTTRPYVCYSYQYNGPAYERAVVSGIGRGNPLKIVGNCSNGDILVQFDSYPSPSSTVLTYSSIYRVTPDLSSVNYSYASVYAITARIHFAFEDGANIVYGGEMPDTTIGATPTTYRFIRMQSDGSSDSSYRSACGTAFDGTAYCGIKLADGRYLVGGAFEHFAHYKAGRLVIVEP